MNQNERTIVVTGATGLQGGAVTRHLLSGGWHVWALTRNRESEKAQALAALGAEVVQGDMAEPLSLAPIFDGAYGVFRALAADGRSRSRYRGHANASPRRLDCRGVVGKTKGCNERSPSIVHSPR
jgi:uncharacterized protein YbjT (DUF2867 family)